MLRKLLIALALCASSMSTLSFADEVVRWVDEDGVTHFGNAQFAPAGSGEKITLANANAMDVPDLGILHRSNARKPMKVTMLERTKMKNPRGWRGYNRRSSAGDRRGH